MAINQIIDDVLSYLFENSDDLQCFTVHSVYPDGKVDADRFDSAVRVAKEEGLIMYSDVCDTSEPGISCFLDGRILTTRNITINRS